MCCPPCSKQPHKTCVKDEVPSRHHNTQTAYIVHSHRRYAHRVQHMCVYVQTIWPRAEERMLMALRRRHIGFTDARKGGVGCRPPASGLSRRSAVGLSCGAAECCRL
jgi:hypothetical protein